MAHDVQFRVLERQRPNVVAWLLTIVVIAGILGAVGWGLTRVSGNADMERQLAQASAQVEEFRKALSDRDQLLAKAHDAEDLYRSPGQAIGVFYRAADTATESGVVLANPGRHAARLYLFGLVAPASAGEYVAAARDGDGKRTVLERILPDDLGNGYLLTEKVPDGTVGIDLALRPAGKDSIDPQDVRIAARYPAGKEERGVLLQQEPQQVQARSAAPAQKRPGV
ncbi:MAG TPA: hypothetical protein VFG59_05090, partial [Anaeromyxobacter sp.]|nr:hypothetical protein [Anaeromyxobacter sp.]